MTITIDFSPIKKGFNFIVGKIKLYTKEVIRFVKYLSVFK